ncbi:high-affinity nickel-transport protein-domain-containing protein [Tirmania nivea]|nr:high-affinity nickel-transport protein-domain-containing protein [Tirmania nivea]
MACRCIQSSPIRLIPSLNQRRQIGSTEIYGNHHSQIPYLQKLPAPVLGIIVVLIVANLICWAGVGVVLVDHFRRKWRTLPLMGTAVLAYTLGLRHALDADHISAIDLMTRRLIASSRSPVTVGMYFSLGHSTIVIITSIAVAATAAALSDRFDKFSLLRKGGEREIGDLLDIPGAGCLFQLFRGIFKVVDRPWKMYPLGVLSGMCLLDTTDGDLMSALYTSSSFAQDQIAILYYSIVLTIITVIVAIVIGAIQSLSLIPHAAEPTGRFWDGVEAAGHVYDIIGECIIASLVVLGVLSMLVYKPWRRRVDNAISSSSTKSLSGYFTSAP